jgi:ATP-binding cassette, subfamily B, bacterial
MKDIVKIIKYTWELKRFYISIAFFVVIISALSLVTPFALKFVVDGIVEILGGGDVSRAYFVGLIAFIFFANALDTLLSNANGYLGDMLAVRIHSFLAKSYFGHLLSLPVRYFDDEAVGKITSKLERGITTISQMMNAFANNFSSFILTSVFTVVILAYYSWPVALFLALLFPIYIYITKLSSNAWQKKQLVINKDLDTSQGRFIEAITQMRAVKAFAQSPFELGFFSKKRTAIEEMTRSQSIQWHKYDILRRLSLNIIFLGVYGYIILETFNGTLTLGEMTLMIQLATQAQFPLFASSYLIDALQRAQAGSRDFFEVMEEEPEEASSGKENLLVKKGAIEYKNVSFEYSEGANVLNDMNFKINPNERVALIGESGEGKTTVTNLLLGFYMPTKGSILIDGQDIKNIDRTSLRENIAVVFQDPLLFSGTIKENISYGKMDATDEQIIEAAKDANAHDFIMRLPDNYEGLIGERGIKLSGGQKQRIAIARAILKNAPILVLDEATSSLDSKAEIAVQDALERLMQGKTVIIIAHRLSTIKNADTIIGIKNGRVIESGSPQELQHKKDGMYSELLELQTNISKLKKYDIAK